MLGGRYPGSWRSLDGDDFSRVLPGLMVVEEAAMLPYVDDDPAGMVDGRPNPLLLLLSSAMESLLAMHRGQGSPVIMLRSKAFVKVTGKGGVVKVVREHYLRDDIGCGVKGCPQCPVAVSGNLVDPVEGEQVGHSLMGNRLLIPDTNILLHHVQLDVIENGSFQDVILLQTVLDEVRNRSPSLYQRLRSMLTRTDKRCHVFSNEHHRETYGGESVSGESPNDRNDRAIRTASGWYGRHLASLGQPFDGVRVVMLSNDVGNRERKDPKDLYEALSLAEYCSGLKGADDLPDLVYEPIEASPNDKMYYPQDHLSPAQLDELLKSGKGLRGTLQVTSQASFEGNVQTGLEGSGELASIRVSGRQAMNRAMHGDSVVVVLLGKGEKVDSPDGVDGEEDGLDVAVPAIVSEESASSMAPRGKIVGVVGRKWRAYCGSIDRKGIRPDATSQTVLFCPMDRRIPRIRIKTRQATDLSTQRILVAVDGWDRRSAYPHGHLVRQLGPTGDKATETEAILLEHDVAHAEWTPAVLACLPEAGEKWTFDEAGLAAEGREDLRHLDVCSIDPPGCTDIDDALHAIVLPSGLIQVGVHIADVTHFVQTGKAIDEEAAARGTTVYLVDRRIDMLPSLLGTNLCSLRSNVDRFAFSCIWEMDPETAEVVSTRFTKSVIRSRASFTYQQAQDRLDAHQDGPSSLDGLSSPDPLTRSIHRLNHLAKILRARRIEAGALVLASPEVRFQLDQETQNPVDVELKEMKAANSLVEEFMLLANISVARQLYASFPDTAILRRHPAPPPENFESLNRALAQRNPEYCLDVSSSKALAASLDKAADPADPYLNKLVRIMATRCMYQAQYFPAGAHPYPAFWHYGLACPIYTHFTSPIRRYADVLVHRLLHASIDPSKRGSAINWDKARGEDLCNNLNYRNRMAQQAQRASVELYTQLFFKGKTLATDAYVIKLMATGALLLIPQYGIEGMVHLPTDLLAPGTSFDPETSTFLQHGKQALGLFQHVQIAIRTETHEVAQREQIRIELVQPQLLLSAAESEGTPPKRSKA